MSHTIIAAGQHPDDNSARPAVPAGHKIKFWFENRRLEGRAGDSIAKALFRNGIRTLSHSVKYGRPRSIHCGRGRCVKCHVEVDGKTGVKSCLTPLREDMRIRRQNYKPFYGNLLTAIMGRLSLPAGFYYRVFTRPRPLRSFFVSMVRRLAGVGRLANRGPETGNPRPVDQDIRELDERYDVVVVGSGLSGMAAAVAAGEAGAGVLLVDEYGFPGGHSIGFQEDTDLAAARDGLAWKIEETKNIKILRGATAFGFYPPGRLLLGRESGKDDAGGMTTVSAASFIFATGAQDITPLFENNDLPGVFGARAIRLFLERDGLQPGEKAVIYGSGPGLANTAGLLRSRGIQVAAIVDGSVPVSADAPLQPAGLPDGTRFETASTLIRAEGNEWISRAVFKDRDGNPFSLPCDLLCIASPGQPSFELAQQAGFTFFLSGEPGKPDLRVMQPQTDVVDDEGGCRVLLTGEAAGKLDWKEKINHAVRAGVAAAGPRVESAP
jgi:sarcosine oxidase subunit alpha